MCTIEITNPTEPIVCTTFWVRFRCTTIPSPSEMLHTFKIKTQLKCALLTPVRLLNTKQHRWQRAEEVTQRILMSQNALLSLSTLIRGFMNESRHPFNGSFGF